LSESKSVEDVKKALGSDVVEACNIFEKDNNVCIKPKTFLGKTTFNDILAKVRDLGGSYGNGLFTVPVETKGSQKDLKKDLMPLEELHRSVLDLKNYVDMEFERIIKKIGDLKRS